MNKDRLDEIKADWSRKHKTDREKKAFFKQQEWEQAKSYRASIGLEKREVKK